MCLIEIAATLALNQFQQRYTQEIIINDPLLRAEEIRLTEAKTKAWNDRFAAESAAYLPTLASILWIVAKSGFTEEVAPFLNLSKATRECKNLQRYMREVMNWQNDDYVYTQLHFFCWKGFTEQLTKPLQFAALVGTLSIVKILVEEMNVEINYRDDHGRTALWYANQGPKYSIAAYLVSRGGIL